MDIYCGKCGEPWDMDEIHDEIDNRCDGRTPDGDAYRELYDTVKADFFARGCAAFTFAADACVGAGDANRAAIASVLYDAFGDDLDGVASDLADAEWLGVI